MPGSCAHFTWGTSIGSFTVTLERQDNCYTYLAHHGLNIIVTIISCCHGCSYCNTVIIITAVLLLLLLLLSLLMSAAAMSSKQSLHCCSCFIVIHTLAQASSCLGFTWLTVLLSSSLPLSLLFPGSSSGCKQAVCWRHCGYLAPCGSMYDCFSSSLCKQAVCWWWCYCAQPTTICPS